MDHLCFSPVFTHFALIIIWLLVWIRVVRIEIGYAPLPLFVLSLTLLSYRWSLTYSPIFYSLVFTVDYNGLCFALLQSVADAATGIVLVRCYSSVSLSVLTLRNTLTRPINSFYTEAKNSKQVLLYRTDLHMFL